MKKPSSEFKTGRALTSKDMKELAKANANLIIKLIHTYEESDPKLPVLNDIESLLIGSIRLMDSAQRKLISGFISKSEFVKETDASVQAALKRINNLLTATPLPPLPKPTMPLSDTEQEKLKRYILDNPGDFYGNNREGNEYWVPSDGTAGLSFEAIDQENIKVFVHPYRNLTYKPIGEFSLDLKTAREYINNPKKKVSEGKAAQKKIESFNERVKIPSRQRLNLFFESVAAPLMVSEEERRLAEKCIIRNWRDYLDKGVKSDGTSKVSIESQPNNQFSLIVSYPGWVGLKTQVFSILPAEIKNLAAEELQYLQSQKPKV
ncbi:hypothetical protein [Legionella parisiensis]|uniref:Uncharacterized protein n=1 Tax=Legionella parisiensis TaxID=45071 RepID=A0A1E5JSQ9_9GAMM|nr:hypothetical protein [Legionella parisiensis]KTD40112.1 hypothetical protein Lpar_1429 [Legionella parisiensis]OEH47569.1 hypothetical protein lpari_01421 [Legionella parisiensis]STX77343.1 Uncharacterised protein [Legionella parisiensis]